MSSLEVRKCGSGWTYCDGQCSDCKSAEFGYSSGTIVKDQPAKPPLMIGGCWHLAYINEVPKEWELPKIFTGIC